MIIIVEGIDRVGKTTLCKKLSKKLEIPIHKPKEIVQRGYLNNKYETDKIINLARAIDEVDGSIIFDRLYLSDYVYGIMERDYYKSEADWNFNLIEHELNKYDTHLILVHPTNIEESSFEHGSNLAEHYSLFKKKFKESSILEKYETNYNEMASLIEAF